MNYEKQIPTIQEEASRLRDLLTAPDARDEAHLYFEAMTREMLEAVSVTDVQRALHSCELLLRNVVNASNNTGRGEALTMMSDVWKEIIDRGASLTGINFKELEQTPVRQLESLQIALNGEIELPLDYKHVDLYRLMDGLLWANESLFNRPPKERDKLTKFTDLGYYIDNIAAARLGIQPQR